MQTLSQRALLLTEMRAEREQEILNPSGSRQTCDEHRADRADAALPAESRESRHGVAGAWDGPTWLLRARGASTDR